MLPLPLSSVDERGTEERGLSAASQPRKRRRADKVGVSSGHLEEGRERGEYAEDKGGGDNLEPWDWMGDDEIVCKEEEDERCIPPVFHMYEAGSSERLRILDGFSLYSKDGQLVQLQALDDPSTRCSVIAYGSVVEPMHPDILFHLQKMEKSASGCAVPYKYCSLLHEKECSKKASSASTIDHRHHIQGGRDGGSLQIKNGDVGSTLKIRIKLGNSESDPVEIPTKRNNLQRGHSLRDILYAYRHCGVVFYYNERAPLDRPIEYEGCNMRPIDGGPDEDGFDRAALTYNSKVDAFCQTTVKWYGAKVVGVSDDNSKVLIHFNGWKKQFDEYVDRGSYRLAAYGTHSTARTELEALTLLRKEQLQTVIYCPPRKRRRVRLCDLQYWCTDYTMTERPVLWLVTNDAWYKIKGGDWWDPVEPSGLYAATFDSVCMSFDLMGLFLPILRSSPGSSLRDLTQKLEEESGGKFCFADLVESHSFIIEQLEQLGPLRDELPATEEPFSKQLLTAGEAWERSRASRIHKQSSSDPCNSSKPEIMGGQFLVNTPVSSKGSANSSSSSCEGWEGHHMELDPLEAALAAAEGERQRQEALAHLPCPDDILWKALSNHGEPSLPPPPTSSLPLVTQNPQFEEVFLGDLIASWSFLHMFGSLFDAPSCTLEALMKALCISHHEDKDTHGGVVEERTSLQKSGAGAYGAAPKGAVPSLITCIHMRLLDFILQDQVKTNISAGIERHGDSYWDHYFFSFQSSGDSDVPPTGAGGGDATRSAMRKSRSVQPSYPTTSASSLSPYGMNNTMTADNAVGGGSFFRSTTTTVEGLRGSWELLRATPMGWLELVRLLYLRKEGLNPKRLFDPLGECRRILKHVIDETMKSEDMKRFVKLKSSGTGNEIANTPPDGPVTDLNVLWSRMESGWYDTPPDAGELPGGVGKQPITPLPTLEKPRIGLDSCYVCPADAAVPKGENGVCSGPPLRKEGTPSSQCGGPEGFIRDVRDFSAFYSTAYGEGSSLAEQASSIVEDITSLFKGMVELPMSQLELELKADDDESEFKEEPLSSQPDNSKIKKQKAAGCCPVAHSKKTAASYKMYSILSTLEYDQWPVAARVLLLRWLCNEASATETFHSLCDSILTSGEDLKCKNKEARSLVKAMRSSRRRTLHDSADPTQQQQTDSELLATVLAQEGVATKEARAIAELRVRLSPLGSDRLHRRYWLLGGKGPIYVEDRGGRWSSYVAEDSAKALVQWLDVRGTHEGQLRKVIIALLVENYGTDVSQFSKPPMSYGKRKPLSTAPRMCALDLDGIEVNWQMRNDDAAQQRDTLRHQRRKLVLSPSLLAPAYRDAYATSLVLLTFQLPVGLKGLGVGLSQRHASVIIAEFTNVQMTRVPNPAQMAGICLGDELVSIGGVFALTPTQLASDVKKSVSIGSDEIVPINVLRLVKLIDDSNQPGPAAQYGGMLHVIGTLLARESMLAHPYVLGSSWNKIHRYKWRQQMVAAVDESTDHVAALDTSRQAGGKEITRISTLSTTQENRRELRSEHRSSHRISRSPPKRRLDDRQEDADELEYLLLTDDKETVPFKKEQQRCCGVRKVAQCILQFETALALQGTLLHSGRGWTPARRRKWRAYTSEARTAAQLLVSWASLDGIVEWSILQGVTQPIQREKFLSLLQSHSRNQIPNQGDIVVYFGAGHVSACKRDTKLGLRPTWGGDDPITDATFLCRVIDITYESSGPPSVPERCEPFVILELEAISPSGPPPQAVLLPPISERAHFSRLLMRVLRAVKQSPQSSHFMEPVRLDVYPDYTEYVEKPMDLGTACQKCKAGCYSHESELAADLCLVMENCHRYCDSRFPELPRLCDEVVGAGLKILHSEPLASELRIARDEITVDTDEASSDPVPCSPDDVHPSSSNADKKVDKGQNQNATPSTGSAASSPGNLRVAMHLNNAIPEFCVEIRKYRAGVLQKWRAEDHVKVMFLEETEGGVVRKPYLGTVCDICPPDKFGFMPWECIGVEWDEGGPEPFARINPWDEVEFTS